MIRVEEGFGVKMEGTPIEILAEIGSVVEILYRDSPKIIKPQLKKILPKVVEKALKDDPEDEKQEEPREEKKPIFDDDSIADAAAKTLAKMIKKNPAYLVIIDDLLEFYTEAVKELLGRDKEEKNEQG